MSKTRIPTSRELEKLKRGEAPAWLTEQVYAVIRYYVTFPGSPDVAWNWALIFKPTPKSESREGLPPGAVEMERKDAMEIIENNNLCVAMKNRYGEIYEMPGKPFLEKFKNYFSS